MSGFVVVCADWQRGEEERAGKRLGDVVAGRSPLTITVPTTLVPRSSSPA